MKAPDPELDFARWIVWEDEGLLAVNKPAGVLSQGGEGGAGINVVDLARGHLGRAQVGVLHRLDRNVSGLVLVSKHAGAARVMTSLFARGGVTRIYRAVVLGQPASDAFTLDAALAKDPSSNQVRAASTTELACLPAAQQRLYRPARTEATVVQRLQTKLGPCAQLELRPITGRSHQLRVHLAHAGLPILGDPKYGAAAQGLNRPLLHSTRLEFTHPHTRATVHIEAPLPWSEERLKTLSPQRPHVEGTTRPTQSHRPRQRSSPRRRP